MGEFWGHYTKWNNPDRKGQIVYDALTWIVRDKLLEAMGWEMEDCLVYAEMGKSNKFCTWMVVMAEQQCGCA
jgi:hypothetical protein